MSLTTYAGLVDAIYKWLLRDSTDLVVTLDQVQNYITLAEAEMNRQLRVLDLEKTANLTWNSAAGAALPADYREMITFQFSDTLQEPSFMTRANLKHYANSRGGPGRPGAYTIYGGYIVPGPAPAGSYAMSLDYYAAIPPLTANSGPNFLLLKHPDAYLYGAQRQALMQTQDQVKLQAVGANYTKTIEDILQDDMNAKLPSGTNTRPRNPIGGRR